MAIDRRVHPRTWRYALAGGLCASVAAGVGLAWWLVSDVEDVTRGSLAWWVMLPGYLRGLPTPEACDPPRYSFQGIDGARPQVAALRFGTRLSTDATRAAYAAVTSGCRPDGVGTVARWRCAGRDFSEIEIRVGDVPPGACRRVDVRFIAR